MAARYGLRPWTDEEDARLRSMLAEGMSMDQAAASLGRSCQSVASYANRKRIRPRNTWVKWTPEEERKLRACAGRLPLHVIAKALGRAENGVRGKARELGLSLALSQEARFEYESTVSMYKAAGFHVK